MESPDYYRGVADERKRIKDYIMLYFEDLQDNNWEVDVYGDRRVGSYLVGSDIDDRL